MSNLFDDEDEQEFTPQQQEQPQQQVPMEEPMNPYAAQMPEEQKQDLFGGEEEEYRPQEVPVDQAAAENPYAQEGMPLGFGAERANLMGEAPVSMPEASTAVGNSVNSGAEETQEDVAAGAQELIARANNAKTNLIQEILTFNTEREQAEGALEDHKDESEQNAALFTVRDPVKVGKIMKYTVTGRDQQGEWTCQRRFNEFEAL